jgi:hypothetical protein
VSRPKKIKPGYSVNGLKLGAPIKITEEVIKKLEGVLRLGVSDKVACEYAIISRDTFYRELKDNKDFSDRINAAKHFARIAASQVVMNAIVQDKDVNAAQWWLEHKHKDEFGAKSDFIDARSQQINIVTNYDELASRLHRLFGANVRNPNQSEA